MMSAILKTQKLTKSELRRPTSYFSKYTKQLAVYIRETTTRILVLQIPLFYLSILYYYLLMSYSRRLQPRRQPLRVWFCLRKP